MTQQIEVVLVEPESLANLFHLLDKARQIPKRGLIRLVAVSRAEMVVVIILNCRPRQIAVATLEVFVSAARPAVQQQQLNLRIVADALGPAFELALWRLNLNLPDAAAQYIFAARIIEVSRHAGWLPGLRCRNKANPSDDRQQGR